MACVTGARCRIGCLHAEFVQTYREERQRQERVTDDMYPQERRAYLSAHPLPTFKDWLLWHRSQLDEVASLSA